MFFPTYSELSPVPQQTLCCHLVSSLSIVWPLEPTFDFCPTDLHSQWWQTQRTKRWPESRLSLRPSVLWTASSTSWWYVFLPLSALGLPGRLAPLPCWCINIPDTPAYSDFAEKEPTICQGLHHLIREGNGTPLQYSCLENPRDGGAWWAAVHGALSECEEGKHKRKSEKRAEAWNLLSFFYC